MIKALDFLSQFGDYDTNTRVLRIKYLLANGETLIGTNVDIYHPLSISYFDSVSAFPMFFSDCGRSFLNSEDTYLLEVEDNRIPEVGSLQVAVERILGTSLDDLESPLNAHPLLCAELLGSKALKVESYRYMPKDYWKSFEVKTDD